MRICDNAFKWHLRRIDYCVFIFWSTSFNTVGKLFTFASLFKLCWQKAEQAECFIYLVSFYEFNIKYLSYFVCILTVFKHVSYYGLYKCFVFCIVLNHNVVCDVIWIKSVIESHLAFELVSLSWRKEENLWRKWCTFVHVQTMLFEIKKLPTTVVSGCYFKAARLDNVAHAQNVKQSEGFLEQGKKRKLHRGSCWF